MILKKLSKYYVKILISKSEEEEGVYKGFIKDLKSLRLIDFITPQETERGFMINPIGAGHLSSAIASRLGKVIIIGSGSDAVPTALSAQAGINHIVEKPFSEKLQATELKISRYNFDEIDNPKIKEATNSPIYKPKKTKFKPSHKKKK